MNISDFPEFYPSLGQNIAGFAVTSDGLLPCKVEYYDQITGFLFITANGKPYRVYRTDFKPMPQINSRFRQYVFDSVAHIWASALKEFPNIVTVDPSPLSPDTFAKKLRDSREARRKYGWKNPLVNDILWTENSDKIQISIQDSMVEIGSIDAKRSSVTTSVGVIHQPSELNIEIKNTVEIEALCRLIHERCFGSPRPVFNILGVTAEQVDSLEQRYDVAFVSVDEKQNKWQII